MKDEREMNNFVNAILATFPYELKIAPYSDYPYDVNNRKSIDKID